MYVCTSDYAACALWLVLVKTDSLGAQIEEKMWAQRRRGSDATSASRPISALGSPYMRDDDHLDGMHIGSFKLPPVMEPEEGHAAPVPPPQERWTMAPIHGTYARAA